MLFEIKNDVYFISSRLKEIDDGYKIFYNSSKNVFEIHNVKQIGNDYCLTIPYNVLDYRTIELVRKTRIENSAKIFEEIDKNNEKLKTKRENELYFEVEKNLRKIL